MSQGSAHAVPDADVIEPLRNALLRVADEEPAAGRREDLGEVAADLLAVPLQELDLPGDDVRWPEAVPDVGVAGGDAERHPLSAAADEQGQPLLDRLRLAEGVGDRVVPAGERRALVVEERADQAARLTQLREPDRDGVERDAVHPVLGLMPGRAEPEDRAPARDVVERGGHLREDRGVPVGVAGHEHRDLHVLRDRTPGGEDLPALEVRTRRVADERDEVIPGHERVVAEPVHEEPVLAHLVPGDVLRVELDTEVDQAAFTAGMISRP